MKSHNFNHEAKIPSREYNLRQVMRCPNLYDKSTRTLLRDWVELSGFPAHGYEYLLEQEVLGQHPRRDFHSRFVGLEYHKETYQNLCRHYGQDGVTHVFKNRTAEIWFRPGARIKNVGVFNYDTTYLANSTLFADPLPMIWEAATQQAERIGNFALILNVGIEPRWGSSLEDFRKEIKACGGTGPSDKHLLIPGVKYQGRKKGTWRINYCVLFGPVRRDSRDVQG